MTQPPLGYTLPCDYVHTTDGDTVKIRVAGREVDVRIMTLLAPEMHDRNGNGTYVIDGKKVTGQQSKDHLTSLLSGGKSYVVFIPMISHDNIAEYFTFGRIRAFIFVDGKNVAELMIAAKKAKRNTEWK